MSHHACEPTHPEPTSQDTLQTSDPKIFISHMPVLNFAGTDYTSHVCQPLEPRLQRYTTKPQTLRPKIFISYIPLLNFAGAAPHITPRMCANPSWTNLPRHTTKFRSSHTELCRSNSEQMTPRMCANPRTSDTKIFITHLFWTLPEQLSMSHHACEPTHPEPTSQDTLQTSDPKIFILHMPVLNFAGTDYTSHVCQPWTKVPKIHHKTSDRKIFISHICLELCQNSSPYYTTNVSQPILNQRPKTHYKLQIRKFSSYTSLFWTLPEQITPRMCANPEPRFQRYTTKPQTLRPKIFISHIPLLNFAGAALHITPRMCANPSWTNVPRHTTNFNPKIFISHIPVLNFAGTTRKQMTPRMCANPRTSRHQDFHHTSVLKLCRNSSPCHTTHVSQPILNQRPKTHYKLQIRKFSSHTCLFWTLPEQITPRMCANPEPRFQRYTTKPQTPRFASHTSLLNFAGAALHITPRMCANPSWTNLPRHTTNFRSENFHLTHPCFELCRNNSETDDTTQYHACVPTLNQRSKNTPQNLRP